MSGMARNKDVIALLPDLRRYAQTLTRNTADAEDLLSSALLRAHEHRHTYQPSRSLRRWLFAIIHNLFVSQRRTRLAEQRRDGALADLVPSGAPATQEMSALLAQVMRRFDTLPDNQRAVLHLIAVEGMSYQEAAETLAVPIGTIMSRLSRARRVLRGESPVDRSHAELRVVGKVHHD